MVTVQLRNVGAGDRASFRLEMHCTCSEFRSCTAGLGGKSRQAAARICTCCLVVVAANALANPEDVANGKSAWLLAATQPIVFRTNAPPAAATITEEFPELDELFNGPRFPEEWTAAERVHMRLRTGKVEDDCASGGDVNVTDVSDVSIFPASLQPLQTHCPHCCDRVGANSFELHPQRNPWRGGLNEAWVFIGAVVRRRSVTVLTCTNPAHPKAAPCSFHPRGVQWSTKTKLFNVEDGWLDRKSVV